MAAADADAAAPRRYLVVANQTLGGPNLGQTLYDLARAGPAAFHIVVPCTPPPSTWTWSEGQAAAQAQERLDLTMRFARCLSASVTGSLGDIDPALAAREAVEQDGPFDEVIVATHPPRLSRWLKLDVLSRVRATTGLPVTHVVADAARTHADALAAFRRFAAARGVPMDDD